MSVSSLWGALLALALVVPATRECSTVEPSGGPSQTIEHARRDGVIAEIAALDLRYRVPGADSPGYATGQAVDTPEGTWIVSRPIFDVSGDQPCVGDTTGRFGVDFVCDFDYVEVLLLDENRMIERAFPFSGTGLSGLVLTDDAIYCYRSPDGAKSRPMVCRIDRESFEVTTRVWPSVDPGSGGPEAIETDAYPGHWHVESELPCVQATESRADAIEVPIGAGLRVDLDTVEIVDCLPVSISAPVGLRVPADYWSGPVSGLLVDLADTAAPRVWANGWFWPRPWDEPVPSPIPAPAGQMVPAGQAGFVLDGVFYVAGDPASGSIAESGADRDTVLFPPLFASSDGVEWSQVPVSIDRPAWATATAASPYSPPSEAPAAVTDIDVLHGPDSTVVHATGWALVDGATVAAYWRSTDGTNWTFEQLPRVESAGSVVEYGTSIAHGPAGTIITVGGATYGGPGWMTKAPSSSWQTHRYENQGQLAGSIAATPRGFVMHRLEHRDDGLMSVVLTSSDGVEWTVAPDLPTVAGSPDDWQVQTTTSGAVVAVASAPDDLAPYEQVVLTVRDGDGIPRPAGAGTAKNWVTGSVRGTHVVELGDGYLVTASAAGEEAEMLYLFRLGH